MESIYWHKQTQDKPVFPDLLWSKPQNKLSAGKLLIIGGNVHGFAAVAEAFQEAHYAGIGSTKVLVPNALQKIVGTHFETAEFASSTPAGSFSKGAFSEAIDLSNWADASLLTGDLGRNSETAIFIESYLSKSSVPIVITKDAADYAINLPKIILERDKTCLVISIAQLQKLFEIASSPQAITFNMDIIRLVDALHNFTIDHNLSLITKHLDQLVVAHAGQVSTTPTRLDNEDHWRVQTAAHATVWWLQNPSKPFEAMTTSVINSSPDGAAGRT